MIMQNGRVEVMIVSHCIYLVEEPEQNKWKLSQIEEQWPKNKEEIAKCEIYGLSGYLSEKGVKACNHWNNPAHYAIMM